MDIEFSPLGNLHGQGSEAGLSRLVLEEGLASPLGALLPHVLCLPPPTLPSVSAFTLLSPTILTPVLSPSVPPQLLLPRLIHPGLHVPSQPHPHPRLSLHAVPSPSWMLVSLSSDASPSPHSCPKGSHPQPVSCSSCIDPEPHPLSQAW